MAEEAGTPADEPQAGAETGDYSTPDFDGPEETLVGDTTQPVGDAGETNEVGEAAGDSAPDEWADVTTVAERYGFTEEDAKSYGSREAFDRTIAAMDRQAAAFGKEQLRKQADSEPGERQRDERGRFVQQEQQAPPQQMTDAQRAAYKKYELGINEDEWDPETVKVLSGLNEHYDSTIRQQQEQLALQEQLLQAIGERVLQDSGRQQSDDTQHFVKEMDTFFDSLGDEYKDVFGKGAGRLLPQASQELAQRQALVEEMRALDAADAHTNRPRQSYTELAQRAMRLLHHDKIKETARKEVEAKLKARSGQQLNRPTGKNGKSKNPRDAALSRVEDYYRQKGFAVADMGDDEDVQF